MKNKIFQFIYYRIVKPLTPKGKFSQKDFFNSYGLRFFRQAKLAKTFDKNFVSLFGDSEIEGMADEKFMSGFPFVICNDGKGGSKPAQLIYFFTVNKYGKKIYKMKKNKPCIISSGGNCMWNNETGNIEAEFLELRKLFPFSIMMTLPPVNADWLQELTKGTPCEHTAKEFNAMVSMMNKYIKIIWGDFIIDMNKILTNTETQKAYWFALKDPVHYSDIAEKIFKILAIIYIKIIKKFFDK